MCALQEHPFVAHLTDRKAGCERVAKWLAEVEAKPRRQSSQPCLPSEDTAVRERES